MLPSQLSDVKALDANQDGHTDLYFQQKTSSNINSPIKISETIYSDDGNGYFENSNLLEFPDFEGFVNGLSAKGMITIDDADSGGKLDIIKTDAWMHHSITEDIVEKKHSFIPKIDFKWVYSIWSYLRLKGQWKGFSLATTLNPAGVTIDCLRDFTSRFRR